MRYFLILLMVIGLVSCGNNRQQQVPKTTKVQPPPEMVSGNPKFADSDPVEWTGSKPWHYPVHGVDVSRYQVGLDWDQLRANHISFGFIKATEGGDHTDPQFYNHWREAERVGIPRGAYHFYYFCRTPEEQARWFIQHVPKDPAALPPVLDIEWNHQSRTCRLRPDGETVRNDMRTFLRIVEAHYGKRPVIYTTPDFYKENDLGRLNGYPYWLRSVADHPSNVYPGERWVFWQYSGTGRVPGSPGDIDLNVFDGTPALWRMWLAQNGIALR
ncbi:glycoside hydrolase family 25 protein [Neptunicoccus cionae]|uniref:glycoside hydrolase family 25 protein n=1 Tax=Neptunicoccus cionae TaxID=2035344 RepID=UPI00257082B5|nr:GH25 family lysozyme [Amylibacter cionae]